MPARVLTTTALAAVLAFGCLSSASASDSTGPLLPAPLNLSPPPPVDLSAIDLTNSPATSLKSFEGLRYETGWFGATSAPGNQVVFDFSKGANLSLTGRVPDTFVWPGQMPNIGMPASLDLYEPPAAFGSYNEYWDNTTSGGWQPRGTGTSTPAINLTPRISPTPEPTIIGLGFLGGLGVLMLRNRLRRV